MLGQISNDSVVDRSEPKVFQRVIDKYREACHFSVETYKLQNECRKHGEHCLQSEAPQPLLPTLWEGKNKFQKAEIILKASYSSMQPAILSSHHLTTRQIYIICQNSRTKSAAQINLVRSQGALWIHSSFPMHRLCLTRLQLLPLALGCSSAAEKMYAGFNKQNTYSFLIFGNKICECFYFLD